MTQTQSKIEKAIFSPEEIGRKTLELIMHGIEHPEDGIVTGIPGLDGKGKLLPIRPTYLVTVLGYTSQGKSSLMNRIFHNNAMGILNAGLGGEAGVVLVTWEQSIEEQGIYDVARMAGISIENLLLGKVTEKEIDSIKTACASREKVPWWLLGHSSLDPERPRLNIFETLEAIRLLKKKWNIRPVAIALDYLQRINRSGLRGEMREQYIAIVDACKDMAIEMHCPVFLLSQTGRQVQERVIGIPELQDGQETSNLEQSSDVMLGTWLPKTKYPDGHRIEISGDRSLWVADWVMLVRIVKQKLGKAPVTLPFMFKVESNSFSPLDWIPQKELEEIRKKENAKRYSRD